MWREVFFWGILGNDSAAYMNDTNHNLRHLAIIMDGNGRWAKRNNKPRLRGHEAGAEAVESTLRATYEANIKYLTLYTFSTENWRRPQSEVNGLVQLFGEFLDRYETKLHEYRTQLNVIGEVEELLPQKVYEKLQRVMQNTQAYEEYVLTLALNYGARSEICRACRAVIEEVRRGRLNEEEIDDTVLSRYLDTYDLPDPDLLIRTGGEMRLSNFLLWQCSYTELWFTETLWPDFSEQELKEAVETFCRRNRRYGAVED